MTEVNIIAEATPYTIDSKVKGFPVLKYQIIVTPWWLNAGFITAAKTKKGTIYNMLNLRAFLPFKYTEYINDDTKDIIKSIGCIKNILNSITTKK